jgi:hypothetical protein
VLDICNNVSPVSLDLILYVFFEFFSNLYILFHSILRILYPFILMTPHLVKCAHHHILLLASERPHILYLELQSSEILRELIHNLFLKFKDQVITICGLCK